MDGNARAAELTEEMEQELAGIRRLAQRYTLVKLAAKILQLEIERYREEHQDPVLVIGSRYFHQMTLGSFSGLRTDVDDKGAPVLIGMRPGDIRVPVEGMSSGTRDQLYLALRLATLEYRLESHEPMPFIVDDILINFDDQRSRATLQALAKLAARNQVILFTHHRQIVDEARNIADKDAVVVHRLQTPATRKRLSAREAGYMRQVNAGPTSILNTHTGCYGKRVTTKSITLQFNEAIGNGTSRILIISLSSTDMSRDRCRGLPLVLGPGRSSRDDRSAPHHYK